MLVTLIGIVIVLFGIYTYKIGRDVGGYGPFMKSVLSIGPGRQVVVDLFISLTMICVWMVIDAIRVGISLAWVALYIVIAIFMGSFGPLFYLLHRFLVVG